MALAMSAPRPDSSPEHVQRLPGESAALHSRFARAALDGDQGDFDRCFEVLHLRMPAPEVALQVTPKKHPKATSIQVAELNSSGHQC
jgi:hypothetical protein